MKNKHTLDPEVEKRFDEKFHYDDEFSNGQRYEASMFEEAIEVILKQFLAKEIAKAKREAREAREECLNEIKRKLDIEIGWQVGHVKSTSDKFHSGALEAFCTSRDIVSDRIKKLADKGE